MFFSKFCSQVIVVFLIHIKYVKKKSSTKGSKDYCDPIKAVICLTEREQIFLIVHSLKYRKYFSIGNVTQTLHHLTHRITDHKSLKQKLSA